MKRVILSIMMSLSLFGQDDSSILQQAAAEELTTNQDNLTADVQELVELQTQFPVIEKLEEVEKSMVAATLKLLESNTGQETLTIQTDIIEKAYQAAEEKSKSQGEGKSDTNKAMMDMLRKMLGKQDSGSKETKAPSPSPQGGEPSDVKDGEGEGDTPKPLDHKKQNSKRTVPAASAYSGQLLPEEFGEYLESYNNSEE